MINSFSIENIAWLEIVEGRVSFSFKSMPDSVHFTLSWKNPENINLHLTKNTNKQNNKPKIEIVSWDKEFADKIVSFFPSFVLNRLFEPISFKKYPRASRKNIRLVFFDELENDKNVESLKESMAAVFKENSKITSKRLTILQSLENNFIPVLNTKLIIGMILNNLRALTTKTFSSGSFRAGIVFMGNRQFLFISRNGLCYVLKPKRTILEFLKAFMEPDFADDLAIETSTALNRIQKANTYADTIQYNKPYRLYLKS